MVLQPPTMRQLALQSTEVFASLDSMKEHVAYLFGPCQDHSVTEVFLALMYRSHGFAFDGFA